MESILEDTVSNEDIKRAEHEFYADLQRRSKSGDRSCDDSSLTLHFQYASCLVRSAYSSDIDKGVKMFESMLKDDGSARKYRRDCLYFAALGCARLKNYIDAMTYSKQFLNDEPENRQAKELYHFIKQKLDHDAMVGAAVAGGMAVAVGSVIGMAAYLMKK